MGFYRIIYFRLYLDCRLSYYFLDYLFSLNSQKSRKIQNYNNLTRSYKYSIFYKNNEIPIATPAKNPIAKNNKKVNRIGCLLIDSVIRCIYYKSKSNIYSLKSIIYPF